MNERRPAPHGGTPFASSRTGLAARVVRLAVGQYVLRMLLDPGEGARRFRLVWVRPHVERRRDWLLVVWGADLWVGEVPILKVALLLNAVLAFVIARA